MGHSSILASSCLEISLVIHLPATPVIPDYLESQQITNYSPVSTEFPLSQGTGVVGKDSWGHDASTKGSL